MNPQQSNRLLAVLLALGVALVLGVASFYPAVYDLVFTCSRLILLALSAQLCVMLTGGAMTGNLLGWLSGVGGLLFVVGVVLDLLGLPNIQGRDLDFLVRTVGVSFMVLPLVLDNLPRPARRSVGLESC